MTKQDLIQILKQEVARETGIPLREIADNSDFFSLGLDSISCVFVLDKLEKKLKLDLNPIYFFDYPTIETFSEYIASLASHE
jgi:polyketide synthase PksN